MILLKAVFSNLNSSLLSRSRFVKLSPYHSQPLSCEQHPCPCSHRSRSSSCAIWQRRIKPSFRYSVQVIPLSSRYFFKSGAFINTKSSAPGITIGRFLVIRQLLRPQIQQTLPEVGLLNICCCLYTKSASTKERYNNPKVRYCKTNLITVSFNKTRHKSQCKNIQYF